MQCVLGGLNAFFGLVDRPEAFVYFMIAIISLRNSSEPYQTVGHDGHDTGSLYNYDSLVFVS